MLLLLGIPGFWDYLMYAFDSMNGITPTQPAPAFQWPQYIGSVLFLIGVFIKYTSYKEKIGDKLRKEKTNFKETYKTLSDDRLQDEFERLYKVKYASIKAIKNILAHKDNKNLVIALFEKAHLNIETCDDWFITKGKFIKLRYNVGFFIWIGFPLLAISLLILAGLEYAIPGVTRSGQYAMYTFLVMFLATTIGASMFFQEIKALGHAITLVNKYRP